MIRLQVHIDAASRAGIERRLTDRRTRVGRLPGIAAAPVETFLGRMADLYAAQARHNAPYWTGRLRRSIRRGRALNSITVTVGAPYGLYVHEGTRPHWPPPGALAGWADAHGIPEFLAARAIARRGTKARPFLFDAFDSINSRYLAPVIRQHVALVESLWVSGAIG